METSTLLRLKVIKDNHDFSLKIKTTITNSDFSKTTIKIKTKKNILKK